MWISGALFDQKRFSFDNLTHIVFFERKVNSFKEVNPQIAISESTKSGRAKLIFPRFTQKQLQIHDGTEIRLNTVGGEGTNEIHASL